MSTLYRSLPSFATDYSGFLSLMHGLGGLMVVHDPGGCLGNYTNCDEPRWFHDPQPAYTTRMREVETVLGDNNAAREKILKEIRRTNPPFVCILGTSVPALTGLDLALLAEEIEADCSIPCRAVETDGFRFYDEGIKKALSILRTFMLQNPSRCPGSVNILGMTPLDYALNGEREKLSAFLEHQGWRVGAFLGMGDTLDAVVSAANAEKNIVMTAAAIPLARQMEREYGIPYFFGPPIGEIGLARLSAFLTNKPLPEPLPKHGGTPGTLLIGEQLSCNALRRFLSSSGHAEDIAVASFFAMDPAQMADGDTALSSEDHLLALLWSGKYDHVIGDPLFKTICPENLSFCPRPHPAVSSKLHWMRVPSQIGNSK